MCKDRILEKLRFIFRATDHDRVCISKALIDDCNNVENLKLSISYCVSGIESLYKVKYITDAKLKYIYSYRCMFNAVSGRFIRRLCCTTVVPANEEKRIP